MYKGGNHQTRKKYSLPSALTSPLSFNHGPGWLNFHNWLKEMEDSESIKL
jgi:hypothetical protein